MNRRWQSFIAWSLAVCFALAGAVAIHPALHRWVEHGGSGHDHHHLGAQHAHPHPDLVLEPSVSDSLSSLGGRRGSEQCPSSSRVAADADALTLFGLQPQDLYRAVAQWLARATESAPVPEGESGHTHHSLPQLLASGLVEGAVEISPLVFRPESHLWFSSVPESRVVISVFFAPTAGRGPPVFC